MSLHHSPGIVTHGLVFAYDQLNIKSYKGPPLQNLITTNNPSTSSAAGYSLIGNSADIIDIPGIGVTTCSTVDIFNNYPAVSTWCCVNIHTYGGCIVTPSTTYTYGIVYKCESGYTSSNFMYRYEYTSNGGTYVSEQGVHNDANRVHLGNGWYYAWGVFTTSATTTWLTGLASFYYRYSAAYDKYSVAKIMLVAGNYPGLHAKFWPSVNTTRTTSQVISDRVGENSVIATSLTYASDGTFSFNGSSNYFTIGASSSWGFGANGTIEQWVYISGNSGTNNRLWCTTNSSSGIDAFLNGATNNLYFHGGIVGTTAVLPSSQWVHLVVTYTGGTIAVYFNGISQALTGTTTGYNITNTGTLFIGQFSGGGNYYFNGKIPSINIYNIGLSVLEVRQNFNAVRGRYGL